MLNQKHLLAVQARINREYCERNTQESLARAKRTADYKAKFLGSTAKKETLTYTGTEIIGIAQMHKSNAQPIFNKQAAVDVAQMRR